MSTGSTYPAEMASTLVTQWEQRGLPSRLLPSQTSLETLLDVAYQASLLLEEGDQVRCRIVVADTAELAHPERENPGTPRILPFAEPMALTPHTIRKLSAAAGYFRSLLAVNVGNDGDLKVWGIVVTGTDWVNRVEGVRYEGVSLPNNLVVQTVGPGHLIAASGYTRVIETKGGELLSEGFDPFRSTWLSRRFVPFRQSLLSQLPTDDDEADAPEMCESFVRDIGQSVVRRVLRLVRNRRHGGMLIFLPNESHDGETLANWLRFRVQFKSDDSALLYRRLMLRLMARAMEIGRTNRLSTVTWNEYQRLQDTQLHQINGELIEFGHLMADMMSVDGSLVLDHSFRLIGFGGEILGDKPVHQIYREFDLEANRSNAEPADTAGTRHRSAYRLVNGLQKAIAVVISQDGDVRFVAYHNDKLTYWPYLP